MKDQFSRIIQLCVMAAITAGVYWIFLDFANQRFLSADASTYLNIAENIANHHGFVVSYNLYQFFNTAYFPLWGYMQPLYPILCSLFINHGGMVQVIRVNILLLGMNAALVYYIVDNLMETPLNILFICWLIFSSGFNYSAIYAWTEQFHFFCFIISFILFLKFQEQKGALFGLGILNGVFMLIRASHLYSFLAYLPAVFIGNGPLRWKIKKALLFLSGFILAYGSYQLFCLSMYHAVYPQYAQPAVSHWMARLVSGVIYVPGNIGIIIPPMGSFFTSKHLMYTGEHLRDFFHWMPVFLCPAVLYYLFPIKRHDGGVVALCLFQSFFIILGYSCTFYFLPYKFESLRYSLIPYVMVSVAGWYSLIQMQVFIGSNSGKWILAILVFCLLFFQAEKFIAYRSYRSAHSLWNKPYFKELLESYEWIDGNLPKEVLVASEDDQYGYLMHRPYISMPPGKALNCTNLGLFNKIYHPDYYLFSSGATDMCFSAVPHIGIMLYRPFKLIKIIK